ncbi:hypothetical protein JCM6882_001225 [Rhodosporidiobolus microsporus]
MAHEQHQRSSDGRPLLPSFASGRHLPPPVPSGYSSARGSDPRAYSYGSTASNGTGWSGGGQSPGAGGGGGGVAGSGGLGGRLSAAATGATFARPATVHPTPRRPLSPARSSLSLRASQPSFSSTAAPPLPSSNTHFLRSSTSFSTLGPSPPPLPRSSSPPLISTAHGRPNISLARTRRVSQVEPDSPTVSSRAPSPAYGNPAERHRSTHANEPGYRSLVRRASGSNLAASAATSPFPAAMGARPSLSAYSSAPSLPLTSAPYASSNPRPPLSTAALHALPSYTPAMPLTNRPASPPKRTNFSALELRMLQGLWNSGGYYPSVQQVEEVQQKTGLSRTQIRNWFANRRQRSTGEEKSRVQRMARELGMT